MHRRRSRLGLLALLGLAILVPQAHPEEIRAWRGSRDRPPAIVAGSPRNGLLQASDGAATTFFVPGGFTTALLPRRGEEGGREGWAIRWSVAGAKAAPVPEGAVPGKHHFLIGSAPRRWRTGVPSYARVRYPSLAAGLEGLIEPAAGGLRWTLRGDLRSLSKISFRYEGVEAAQVSPDGRSLALRTGLGTLTETLPPGARYARLHAGPTEGTFEYRIDPGDSAAVPGSFTAGLAWSGILAGAQLHDDTLNDLVVAPDGTIVGVGETSSPDFPRTTGPMLTGPQDAHITRVNPDGTLAWSTFLGGDSSENGEGVVVEPGGEVLVIGRTRSTDFPASNNALQRTHAGPTGGGDAFVAKLRPDGTGLLWATYLGGNGEDYGLALARGSGGQLYGAGWTGSPNFPQVQAFDTTFGGTGCPPSVTNPTGVCDGWVAEIRPDGQALLISSWFGGSGHDTVEDLAVDSQQALYLVGTTRSSDFPLAGTSFDSTLGGGQDAYLLKVLTRVSPPTPAYATFLGGNTADGASSVWVDPGGGVVVIAGSTNSPDFPVVGGLGFPYVTGGDGFVLRFDLANSALAWSSLIGGSGTDEIRNVALGPLGAIHLVGKTSSLDFPVTRAFETAFGGVEDAWVARISPGGNALDFASFVGGSATDDARCVDVDARGNVYVGGVTNSPDFPRTVLQPNGQLKDGFLLKIDTTPPDAGEVRDGLGADLSIQLSTTSLSTNWDAFTDPDSTIKSYEWAFGTASGQADTRPFTTTVPAVRAATAAGLTLLPGTTYYATVRGYNGAGARATVSSDGVRVVLPLGGTCSDAGQCSTFCTSGVCCTMPSCPTCQACSADGGVCKPVADGTSCSNNRFCDGMEVCSGTACLSGVQVVCPDTDGGERQICDDAVDGCVAIPTPPTILGQPPATGVVGRVYSHTFAASGTQPVTFDLCMGSGPPAGMTLDSTTGTLQWTPTQPGVVAVCVEAQNSAGRVALNFLIDVVVRPVQPGEVSLDGTFPGGPHLLGERPEFTLHARNTLGIAVADLRVALEPSGLELMKQDGGVVSPCDSVAHLDLPPLPPRGQVDVPLSARFCSPGDGGVRLVARLESLDGGRLTSDLVHELEVKASFTTTACGCSGGPGGGLFPLAAAAVWLALLLSRRAGVAPSRPAGRRGPPGPGRAAWRGTGTGRRGR